MFDIAFAELTYYAYGTDLKETIVIMQQQEDHPAIIVCKLLYFSVIVFSYPILIYVTNNMIESYIFSRMRYSSLRKWLKNLSRTIVVIIAAVIGVSFYYKLHIINGFIAVILGGLMVMIVPSLLHNKLTAETFAAKCCNWFVIIYAIVAAIVITIMLIYISATSEME